DERSTLAEIGASCGVSKERIRQIERKALDKLRSALSERAEDISQLLGS
ncbi:MAG: sigma factor-like helix-turn-helix DNA-binding protein, partial [Alphaproteobacteria bacterium]